VPDALAREMTEDFIAEYSGAPKLPGEPKVKVEAGTSDS
jgi:hypothetical protein